MKLHTLSIDLMRKTGSVAIFDKKPECMVHVSTPLTLPETLSEDELKSTVKRAAIEQLEQALKVLRR